MPTEKVLACVPWMLGERGSCITAASLADVCCIRISSGADHRSRDRRYISGLLFEYRGGVAHEAIVGQWINQVDYFTLQPGETLVEVGVRVTADVDVLGERGKVGRVVALVFVTSLGTRYSFRYGSDRSDRRDGTNYNIIAEESSFRFCGSPFEDLVCTWKPLDFMLSPFSLC